MVAMVVTLVHGVQPAHYPEVSGSRTLSRPKRGPIQVFGVRLVRGPHSLAGGVPARRGVPLGVGEGRPWSSPRN